MLPGLQNSGWGHRYSIIHLESVGRRMGGRLNMVWTAGKAQGGIIEWYVKVRHGRAEFCIHKVWAMISMRPACEVKRQGITRQHESCNHPGVLIPPTNRLCSSTVCFHPGGKGSVRDVAALQASWVQPGHALHRCRPCRRSVECSAAYEGQNHEGLPFQSLLFCVVPYTAEARRWTVALILAALHGVHAW